MRTKFLTKCINILALLIMSFNTQKVMAFETGINPPSAFFTMGLYEGVWCSTVPDGRYTFVSGQTSCGNEGNQVQDSSTLARLNQCKSTTGVNSFSTLSNSDAYNETCAVILGVASPSACPQEANGRDIVWCQKDGVLYAHQVGMCARTSSGEYVGDPIDASCSGYEDNRTSYTIPSECSSRGLRPSEGQEVTAFVQSCTPGVIVEEEPDANRNPTVLQPIQAATIAPLVTDNNPNPENLDLRITATAETALNQLDCSDLSKQVPEASTAGETSFEFNFGTSPFEGVAPVLADRTRSTRSTRSRRSNEYDDFEDYEDIDSTGTRDFSKARMLRFCEDQGTSVWSDFTAGLMNSEEAVWDPSFGRFYMRELLGTAGSNGDQTTPKYMSLVQEDMKLNDEDKKFLSRCEEQSAGIVQRVQALTSPLPGSKIAKLKEKLTAHAVAGLKALSTHRKNLEKCEALVSLTKISDYDREYESTGRDDKTIKASFDQRLKCETHGPEAQDFKKCTEFINTYDASMVAKTALNAGQNIHYQSERLEDQNTLSQQGAAGGIDHRGALSVQQGEIKDRAGYATQNAALDSAKLAGLFGILQSMPNRKKLIETCSADVQVSDVASRISKSHSKAATKFLSAFGLTPASFNFDGTPGDPLTVDKNFNPNATHSITEDTSGATSLCEATAKSRSASTLIMNNEFRDQAKAILAQTATEAAASFLAAGMLNKQAKQISELLKRIEGYDPSDNFVAPSEALLSGPCAFDPSAPGCGAGIAPAARNVGFGNNSLTIGGGGFGGAGVNLDADTGFDDAATGSSTGTSDRSGASGPIGSIIPNRNKSNGFESNSPSAASVKSSNAGRASGGGGSGASAVGSTGRGGGGGNGGGSKGGQAGSGKQLSYASSSIGRLSGGRGVGRKPASKDGGANPFANMFKKGGPKSGTLNFRNPAGIGSKSGSIFDRISDRYKVVQSKNLLLEYEEKK